MATRQQKFEMILRQMRAAGDQLAYEYWRDRLVDLVWRNSDRVTIESGK